MLRAIRLLALCLTLFGPATTSAATDPSAVPLLPLGDFFAAGAPRWRFQISPDGSALAWVSAAAGTTSIVVQRLGGAAEPSVIPTRRVAYNLRWATDSRHLVFLGEDERSEQFHLYAADASRPDRPPVDLTPFAGVTVRAPQMLWADTPRLLAGAPGHVHVMMNRRDPTLFDLYRVDIASGDIVALAENPGDIIRWIPDRTGDLVARMRRRPDGGWNLEVPGPGGGWRPLIDGDPETEFTPIHVDRDGRGLWTISNHDRDAAALIHLDLSDGRSTVAHAVPGADVTGAEIDDTDDRPVEAWSCPDYCRARYFDAALERDLDRFRSDATTFVDIASADRGRTRLVVRVESDRAGTSTHLLDRTTGEVTVLRASPIAGLAKWLSPTAPVAFPARDGLPLNGYLTVPTGHAAGPLPMVLLVHGGPWLRDYWGYDPEVQFLANRGYAVLQVNYRGSIGYGRAFVRASKREMARQMHDDLVDGVRWAVDRGIADPARVAIMGTSFGGYATLVGLTVTPGLFAAGVDIVGIADLALLLETVPPYWRQRLPFLISYYGDPADPADRADLAARSPINHVDRIARPLLIVQGERDVRVVREHSDRIVEAMRAAGREVEYLGFPDEGHAIRKRHNRLTMYRRIEEFLARHVGGRAMP